MQIFSYAEIEMKIATNEYPPNMSFEDRMRLCLKTRQIEMPEDELRKYFDSVKHCKN